VQSNMLKIGIDLDDAITYCPAFFSMMTKAMMTMTMRSSTNVNALLFAIIFSGFFM
jgi:hypothetical protein